MFKKKGSIYIIIAVVTLGLLMVLQYSQPKKLNWFPSYVAQHKIPYGTKVFNDLIVQRFTDVEQVTISPFQFLNANPEISGTYVFINGSIDFDQVELDKLLNWTAEGNTLIVASANFGENILDSLGLETAGLFDGLIEDKGQLHQLVHPKLKTEKAFPIRKDSYTNYFSEIDTSNTTVIGIVDHLNVDEKISTQHFNVISTSFGKGKIILSTFPKAFTNYFILKDENRKYTAGLLSYIDTESTLFMDNHHKDGKAFYTSPLYIFLNNKALKWAYYLMLIGAVMYVIFEGKRKQRAIPIVTPLKNQTMAFTRTIADMYFEKKEQKQIAEYKIKYFLEYVRSRFYLNTTQKSKDFYQNLASRSAHDTDEIETLFTFISTLENKSTISDKELIELNSAIDKFKLRADGRK